MTGIKTLELQNIRKEVLELKLKSNNTFNKVLGTLTSLWTLPMQLTPIHSQRLVLFYSNWLPGVN